MSRTVAVRRRHRRSMTSASSGPRNFSSAFSGRRSRRRSGRRTGRLSRAPAPDRHARAAAEEPRMALAEGLAAVSQRDVELHDEVAVPRDVDGTAGALAPLDDPRHREHLELMFRVRLFDARPHRRALGGLLAERERVKEPETTWVSEALEGRRGALVLFVA